MTKGQFRELKHRPSRIDLFINSKSDIAMSLTSCLNDFVEFLRRDARISAHLPRPVKLLMPAQSGELGRKTIRLPLMVTNGQKGGRGTMRRGTKYPMRLVLIVLLLVPLLALNAGLGPHEVAAMARAPTDQLKKSDSDQPSRRVKIRRHRLRRPVEGPGVPTYPGLDRCGISAVAVCPASPLN
jgi:hypothetical protein